jgi:hypothetical protein
MLSPFPVVVAQTENCRATNGSRRVQCPLERQKNGTPQGKTIEMERTQLPRFQGREVKTVIIDLRFVNLRPGFLSRQSRNVRFCST